MLSEDNKPKKFGRYCLLLNSEAAGQIFLTLDDTLFSRNLLDTLEIYHLVQNLIAAS